MITCSDFICESSCKWEKIYCYMNLDQRLMYSWNGLSSSFWIDDATVTWSTTIYNRRIPQILHSSTIYRRIAETQNTLTANMMFSNLESTLIPIHLQIILLEQTWGLQNTNWNITCVTNGEKKSNNAIDCKTKEKKRVATFLRLILSSFDLCLRHVFHSFLW